MVPKQFRDSLGFAPGIELEAEAVDGRLEVVVPSRVFVEEGPGGPRFAAGAAEPLTSEQVRELIERGRR